jgi:nucleoside-diphosphate-sugar epimerase
MASAPSALPDIDVTPAEARALRGAVVAVSGAGGFVATHVVARLLAAGATVRACVRSASSAGHLRELEARYGGKLELFEGCDLLVPGSFDAALRDGLARFVFHTASPFQMAAKGEDLLRAAVGGTREVLSACARLGGASLERVVLTSSVAALHAFVAPDRAGEGKAPYGPADWNVGSSPSRFPYEHSKAAAERWAWAFVHAASGGEAAVPAGALLASPPQEEEKAGGGCKNDDDDDAARTAAALGFGGGAGAKRRIGWSLSVVNPAFVLGPPLSSREDGESVGVVAKLLQDKMLGAWPDVHFGACDVRDVAKVHALAAAAFPKEKAAGKRLIVAPFRSSFGDVVAAVRRDRDLLPRVRLPHRAAFYPVLLLLSPLLARIGLPTYRLRATYGVPAATYDCGDAEALMMMEEGGGGGGGGAGAWTPRDVTVTDMARELLARGLVADASAGRA